MANQTQLNAIAEQLKGIQSKIATEGVTDSSGKTLLAPTITAETLQNTGGSVKLPTQTDSTPSWTSAMNAGNAVIQATTGKTTTDTTGMEDLFAKYTQANADLQGGKASETDLYSKAAGMAGYTPELQAKATEEQNKLNAMMAQLTGITNAGTAENLRLEGEATGKDVTTSFLGRQQSEVTRQAAIKALPLQAAIQAQQAIVTNNTNLLINAKENLNTYYSLLSKDAENEYNYKKELVDNVYNFASKQEQAKLDAIIKKEDRAYDEKQANIKTIQNYVSQALEYGQSDLITEFTSLDTSDPDFQTKLGQVASKLKDPNASLDTYLKQLQIRKAEADLAGTSETLSIDDAKKYNELYPNAGIKVGDTVAEANLKAGVGGATANTTQIDTLTTKLNNINNILSSPGISMAIGVSPIGRFPTELDISGNKTDFIASVNQLVDQETLNTLLNLKKAGGTLGAISEKELSILQNSSSKINSWAIKDKNGNVTGYKTTEEKFKDEINRIKTSTQNLLDSLGYISVDDYLNGIDTYYSQGNVDDIYSQAGY